MVARSIYKEVQAGRGTPHGGAYLDVRHLGADYVKRKLPSMYEQFHALASIDITTQPMEVGPTIHYTMGVFAWTRKPRRPPCRAVRSG